MLAAHLAAATLVVAIATGPVSEPGTVVPMSGHQKMAALQQLVHRATECIVHAVAADPRAGEIEARGNLGDLIVDSMPACVDPVRAMIDRYDDYFGNGAGEAFFMGPYLDVLPNAIKQWVARSAR